MNDIVYLDYAATSYPKPEGVLAATDKCMREYCGNSGRGSHKLAMATAEKIYECRSLLASMLNASPENVIFTQNTTYALNMAILGTLKSGDHAIISNLEHNSTLRPVYNSYISQKTTYSVFDAFTGGVTDTDMVLESIKKLTRKNTRALICTHTSNVCSVTLPVREIGEYCKRKGIIFILDGAQGVGHDKIDMKDMNIDILCLPSHKGLYGPQGCGAMILSDGISPKELLFGGSGVNSLSPYMPDEPPEKYEAGTLPTPSIAGLCEGINFVRELGESRIIGHERMLWKYAYEKLSSLGNKIKIYAPNHSGSILLFNILGVKSEKAGELLSDMGICVRCGYHCAPLAHATLDTQRDGCDGAIRASFGVFNTKRDVDDLCYGVKEILK